MKSAAVRKPDRTARRYALLGMLVVAVAACGRDAKEPPPPPPPHVEAVRISAASLVVELMDSARVTATVHLSDGTLANRAVQWECTRPELVQACGPSIQPRDTGSFRLVARVEGVTDTAHVRIYEEGMRSVVITEPSPSVQQWLLQGTPAVIQVQITDSAFAPRLDRRLRWSSTDTTIAVVRDTTWWNWQVGQWWPGGSIQARNAGTATLTLTVGGQQASLEVMVRPRLSGCDPASTLSLDLAVGELRRYRGTDAGLPTCLQYRQARDGNRRYLVFAERLPAVSSSQAAGRRGLFLGGGTPAADSMIVQIYTPQASPAQLVAARTQAMQEAALHPHAAHGPAEWHIGPHHVRELAPSPERAVREVRRATPLRASAMQSGTTPLPGASSPVAVGDTLVIPRLRTIAADAIYTGTEPRSDRAVVRYVGANLVFAEHLELFGTDLRRSNQFRSAPIPPGEYPRIDAAYGPGQTQLDRLFGRSPTDSLLGLPPGRELVVNTILPAGVWGTAAGDMAFVDYWYGTDGATPGVLQDPLLMTNQLIVHEMSHVRHFLHQPPSPLLLWSIEGIARFAEHLAFAAHVLGSDTPSRSGNAIAGNAPYPTQPQHRSHIEMPTTAGLGTNFFAAYSGSAYVFDYLADHAEAVGRDGLAAVRDVLLNAHDRSAADAAVARALGQPLGFDELVTRSRIALLLDDFPTAAALPAWTQYLQFNIRSSRPWWPNWPNAVPGTPLAIVRQVAEGMTFGVWINGSVSSADQDYLIDITRGEQTVLSIVRFQ